MFQVRWRFEICIFLGGKVFAFCHSLACSLTNLLILRNFRKSHFLFSNRWRFKDYLMECSCVFNDYEGFESNCCFLFLRMFWEYLSLMIFGLMIAKVVGILRICFDFKGILNLNVCKHMSDVQVFGRRLPFFNCIYLLRQLFFFV